jgi:hypothetical protein
MRGLNQSGHVLVQVIVFSTIAMVLLGGLIGWASVNIKASRIAVYREQAIQLAESGVDYYRWHLAHAPTDYQDGTGVPGPYVHEVENSDGILVGEFSLDITPPPLGSTKVRIESTGTPTDNSAISRTIAVEMAIPSLAKYAVVANQDIRFGEGTEVFGPIHSNGGIRFDGLAHNLVSSAVASYSDPDHSGGNEFGVHTHLNPPPSSGSNDTFRSAEAPPSVIPSRPDVFVVGRQFPVPAADFVGIATNLAQMKSDAQSDGRYFPASGYQGYRITFNTDDTFNVRRVNSQTNAPSNCTNIAGVAGWGTWSVNNTSFVGNYNIPENGIIFVEDNVWVEGTINSARATVAAGKFPDNPSSRPNIIVNNNLRYTNFDGSDVLALISQGHIHVGLVSDTDLRIDAALIAQNGRVGRFYYPGPSGWQNRCSPHHEKDSITLYGMIATNQRYGFAYTDGNGYEIRDIIYDANLLYSPPPSFPLTSDQYEVISWEEL